MVPAASTVPDAMDATDHSITMLLDEVRNRRSGAEDRLPGLVHAMLRAMAQNRVESSPAGDSLQSAGLAHDAERLS